MRNTNSKWVIPSIAAVVAFCLACACCGAVGLYFYGDQIIASFNGPVENPQTEIPAHTTGGEHPICPNGRSLFIPRRTMKCWKKICGSTSTKWKWSVPIRR